MAYLMASEEIKKGRATSLVIMTDGSANVADVSRLPNPKAKTLSEKLAANYIPMPFVSSRNLSDAVKASR